MGDNLYKNPINEDKQITSVNPEKHEEKGEF